MFQFWTNRRAGKNSMNALMAFAFKHGAHETNDLYWDNIWEYKHSNWKLIFFTRSNPGMLTVSGYPGTFKIEIWMDAKPVYLCANGGVTAVPDKEQWSQIKAHIIEVSR